MRPVHFLLFIVILSGNAAVGLNQQPPDSSKKITYEAYIAQYSPIAIRHMQEYKIPASITLAQGLLESASGNSELARKANNHFGIKCHNGWEGETYLKDDDAKNDCFRKYKSAEESFADHALFLTTRSRYASLFELGTTDYKGWAHGLKAAGYATNPSYAERLIHLIEKYELHKFDDGAGTSDSSGTEKKRKHWLNPGKDPKSKKQGESWQMPVHSRKIETNNGVKMVIAQPGESLKALADTLQIRPWMLRKFNDLEVGQEIRGGDKIYIQSKKRKGKTEFHTVSQGETLHAISQVYAIRLKDLAKRNNLDAKAPLLPGNILKLR
jgi:LysM repeat protein